MDNFDVTLGVLAARKNSSRRPYHAQTTFFRRLIQSGKEIGVHAFVFSPPGVRWKAGKIRGWTWTGKRWVRRTYSFPDAIYDRVSPKGKADLSGVGFVRRRFNRLAVPRFNTRLGCKWAMHRTFMNNPLLKDALPPTRILTRKSLASMIRQYGSVYTKPVRGGQGRGIVWASKTRTGYAYRIQGASRSVGGRVGSFSSLRSRCGYGRRVVQKAIPILRCDDHPFDVRVLVQRREEGDWDITGLVARLGGRRSRVTNIHAGGKAMRLDETLRRTGADDALIEEVTQTVGVLALETAETISQTGAHVGELGIDFAIDEQYKSWLLEANSRTGRISFHRAGLESEAKLADQGPAAYARHLASSR